jgi:hypothetical protein
LDLATTYVLLIVLQAILALTPRIAANVRQIFAAGALFTACAVLVASGGKSPGLHLFFAFTICVLTLYQDAAIYVGGVLFLTLYHVGLGVLGPEFVYPSDMSRDEAVAWSLSFLFTGIITSMVGILASILNTKSARDSEALKVALAEAGLRERQARDLNDTVVQHLTTAVYASEEGEYATAKAAAIEGLGAARRLVSSLRAPKWLLDAELLRDDPSQSGAQEDRRS